VEEGVDRAVEQRDPIQKRFGHLHGRHLAAADRGDEIDGGELERLHERRETRQGR